MSVRRTTLFVTAASAAVLMALSGCGNSAKESSDSAAPAAAPMQEGAGAGPAKDNGVQGNGVQGNGVQGNGVQGNPPGKIPDNLDVDNRSIIYSGTMTVRVKDVDAAAAQAIAYATGAGGFVGGDNRRHDDKRSQGTLTLRVPAARFSATLDQLKGLGNEEDRQVTAQDVTDQVVDVESRLQTAQASVDRIRALLAKAQTISEITSLESELSRRESDLESLQARKRKLDGLTALSTITLVLLGPEAAVDEEELGIGVGLRNGWSAFLTSAQVALTALGWLLPWLLVLGLPISLLLLLRRYRPKQPAVAAAGSPVPPAPMMAPPRQMPRPTPISAPPGPVPPPPVPGGAGPLIPGATQPIGRKPADSVSTGHEGAGAPPAPEARPGSAETGRSPEPPADAAPTNPADPTGPAGDR
ncbi:DUF4349 domain-containing protein [Dactylosporangium sucinum]|uniref:DUF4349 domain-containing protein n=1 Tax=Dactylosporangium sucinum TaxID=1424081 RepID=A0A917TPP4_9ACTN|nr:DUF4349 domain-containing protein [Dactylosporangium sucinum]GGM32189.1 hypothetical protein GCM10007977_036760 [Dactylosporangium sucinum]